MKGVIPDIIYTSSGINQFIFSFNSHVVLFFINVYLCYKVTVVYVQKLSKIYACIFIYNNFLCVFYESGIDYWEFCGTTPHETAMSMIPCLDF